MALAFRVRPVGAGEGERLRDIRLRALHDSPDAFGSSHAREERLPVAEWSERAGRSARAERELVVVADAGGRWVGMAMGRLETGDRPRVSLFGVWVDPEARHGGVGLALVEALVRWASTRGARSVALWVVSSNSAAIALYRRAGFEEDGNGVAMPGRPSVLELQMVRSIG